MDGDDLLEKQSVLLTLSHYRYTAQSPHACHEARPLRRSPTWQKMQRRHEPQDNRATSWRTCNTRPCPCSAAPSLSCLAGRDDRSGQCRPCRLSVAGSPGSPTKGAQYPVLPLCCWHPKPDTVQWCTPIWCIALSNCMLRTRAGIGYRLELGSVKQSQAHPPRAARAYLSFSPLRLKKIKGAIPEKRVCSGAVT